MKRTNYATEQEVKEFICNFMDKWLFDRDSHIDKRHMNASEDELVSRIGTYSDNGKLLFKASTFVDDGSGDAIVRGLIDDLSDNAGLIAQWLQSDSRVDLNLLFPELPVGVTGLMASYEGNWMPRERIKEKVRTYPVSGYKIILHRDAYYPFYLLNAYPIE